MKFLIVLIVLVAQSKQGKQNIKGFIKSLKLSENKYNRIMHIDRYYAIALDKKYVSCPSINFQCKQPAMYSNLISRLNKNLDYPTVFNRLNIIINLT